MSEEKNSTDKAKEMLEKIKIGNIEYINYNTPWDKLLFGTCKPYMGTSSINYEHPARRHQNKEIE